MKNATLAEVAPLGPLGIGFDVVTISAGPASIENHFDEAFAAPYVAIEAMKAEKDGIDAVVIDCMGDPGLMAAREAVSIPVVGPGEAAMHMAAMMGHRFGCVSILDSVRPIFHMHARVYGIADKLAVVRTINVPVLDIEETLGELPGLLYVEARKAIEEDLVDTIILGCTGFVGVAEKLQRRLLSEAGHDVPVISPLPAAALLAATMVWGNLAHSPHAYPRPNLKKRMVGFPI
jgi:allantoin racemase